MGYSKDCFHETYTSVRFTSGTYSWAVGLYGVSISIPVNNYGVGSADAAGGISLTPEEVSRINRDGYYSCIRFKASATWVKFTSKIYDNASGQLLSTTTYDYTYTFKNNHNEGLDYFHEVRTPTELGQIKDSNYVGTPSERTQMSYLWPWVTVSNPESASIYPWQ